MHRKSARASTAGDAMTDGNPPKKKEKKTVVYSSTVLKSTFEVLVLCLCLL